MYEKWHTNKIECDSSQFIFLFLVIQELSDIRTHGVKNFRNIQVDETNILCWQGLIVPVSAKCLLTKINIRSPVFNFLSVVQRTALPMKREPLESSSPSLQTTPSSPQRSRSRQKSTIPTSTKRARCVCPSLALKTGSRPQRLTKVRDVISSLS